MSKIFLKTLLLESFETKINDPIGGNINGLIMTFLQYAIGIAGLVAVVFIVIGGYQYITSQGNDEQSKKATQTLTYAVIGLLIVMASYAVINTILTNVLG